MKKILITLLFFIPALLHAQQQIKGTVTDGSGALLDGVTMTLTQDNKNISYALADSGKFTLSYKANGSYMVSATLIGYKPVSKPVTFPKDTLKIIMQADSRQLGVVTVSASKPVIERKIDRVIFNVENSIAASGGNLWDALTKAPGVQVTAGNTLTANKKDVQIYMDGQPLHLSADDLSNYLQGLPSDLVAQIEVFSNPPANFEAQGAAVINIVTRKSKKQGLNVALNGGYTQAAYGSYTGSATFNYRKDKLNVYGNYGYTERHIGHDQDDYITYTTPGNTSFWNSPGYTTFQSQGSSYRLGADYQITNNQVVGFLVTGSNRTGSINTTTPTAIFNNNKPTPDSTLQTNGKTATKGNRYAYNLNYNIKLDTGGRNLNIDLDYSPYHSSYDQQVNSFSYLPDGSAASAPYQIYTPSLQNIDIYSGKVDYSYKLGKTWSLNSGLKYSSIRSQNNFDFYNTSTGEPVQDISNSDHFQYTENTAAAYTSISGTSGKWTFQGGLRGELTHTRGYSETLDSLHTNQYFKLFPTLFTVYNFDDNNALQLTYGYRIERPEYARLNPAKHYATPYNYLVGNPDLQPAFVQNIELGYTFEKEYNVTAYYTATHNMFSNVTVQDNASQLFYDTQQNLGLSLNTGLRFSAPFHPTNWWEMSTLAEVYFDREASAYLQGSYNYHTISYDGSTTQSFTLNKNWGLKAELSATYNSSGLQGIFRGGQNSFVDAGIKANILNGQGTVKLAANDIFYTDTYHISVNYLNQNNGFYQRNDTRNLILSFSYRFGKNVAASRKRTTSDEDEKQRTQ